MPPKPELLLMLFYSNLNKESLNTIIEINKFIESHHQSFKIDATAVNYDREKDICQQYGVTGIPTLLVFLNQELVGRHYGEITIKEIETIIRSHLKKGETKDISQKKGQRN